MNRDLLRQYLAFYEDLGIKTVYRRSPAGPVAAPETEVFEPVVETRQASEPGPPSSKSFSPEPPPEPIQPVLMEALPSLAPEGDTLAKIQEDIGDCKRCPLHEGRHKIVFGVGDEHAKLVFVGEGPGADEDAQGIPFVGRAGQLLTQMIEATASKEGIPLLRKDVYICNVVKCRPPENRTPMPAEMETCGQFLFRQLKALNPKAIVALGGTAAKALLAKKEGVTRMRGKWHRWQEIPVMVTYHPSFLLRAYNKNAKRESWEDLKKVLHYVYD